MLGQPIVIMGAMSQEVEAYKTHFARSNHIRVVQCGIGKVACAAATGRAIAQYHPRGLIFSGVAGALEESLALGDICVGVGAVDVDVDAVGFDSTLKPGQLPFTQSRVYRSNDSMLTRALGFQAAVKTAYIATGATFMTKRDKALFNRCGNMWEEDLPYMGRTKPTLCDMESSAFLEVAQEANIPALVVRAVSDTLHGEALEEFERFMNEAVRHYVPLVDYVIAGI